MKYNISYVQKLSLVNNPDGWCTILINKYNKLLVNCFIDRKRWCRIFIIVTQSFCRSIVRSYILWAYFSKDNLESFDRVWQIETRDCYTTKLILILVIVINSLYFKIKILNWLHLIPLNFDPIITHYISIITRLIIK